MSIDRQTMGSPFSSVDRSALKSTSNPHDSADAGGTGIIALMPPFTSIGILAPIGVFTARVLRAFSIVIAGYYLQHYPRFVRSPASAYVLA